MRLAGQQVFFSIAAAVVAFYGFIIPQKTLGCDLVKCIQKMKFFLVVCATVLLIQVSVPLLPNVLKLWSDLPLDGFALSSNVRAVTLHQSVRKDVITYFCAFYGELVGLCATHWSIVSASWQFNVRKKVLDKVQQHPSLRNLRLPRNNWIVWPNTPREFSFHPESVSF